MICFQKSLLLIAAVCLLLLCGCGGTQLSPFSSDGCSLFPDGTWSHCCYTHDLTYWKGGTSAQRQEADLVLRQCVEQTGHSTTASLMYHGVRLFGSAYTPAWFRWGFGWPYGRGYTPLTDEERLQVSALSIPQPSHP